MTPASWIALAYGIVTCALVLYVARLRRRLRELEEETRAHAPRVHSLDTR